MRTDADWEPGGPLLVVTREEALESGFVVLSTSEADRRAKTEGAPCSRLLPHKPVCTNTSSWIPLKYERCALVSLLSRVDPRCPLASYCILPYSYFWVWDLLKRRGDRCLDA